MQTNKDFEWNYNYLLNNYKEIELGINQGNWVGYSENLLIRKTNSKIIKAYLDYCNEGNDCVLWRFCDVYDWYKKYIS